MLCDSDAAFNFPSLAHCVTLLIVYTFWLFRSVRMKEHSFCYLVVFQQCFLCSDKQLVVKIMADNVPVDKEYEGEENLKETYYKMVSADFNFFTHTLNNQIMHTHNVYTSFVCENTVCV